MLWGVLIHVTFQLKKIQPRDLYMRRETSLAAVRSMNTPQLIQSIILPSGHTQASKSHTHTHTNMQGCHFRLTNAEGSIYITVYMCLTYVGVI